MITGQLGINKKGGVSLGQHHEGPQNAKKVLILDSSRTDTALKKTRVLITDEPANDEVAICNVCKRGK